MGSLLGFIAWVHWCNVTEDHVTLSTLRSSKRVDRRDPGCNLGQETVRQMFKPMANLQLKGLRGYKLSKW